MPLCFSAALSEVVCALWCNGEIRSLCHLQDRQKTDESRSIKKSDSKSQICSLILSAVASEDRKERRRIVHNSLSICLIQIFLLILLLSLSRGLRFFCVYLDLCVSFFHLVEALLICGFHILFLGFMPFSLLLLHCLSFHFLLP